MLHLCVPMVTLLLLLLDSYFLIFFFFKQKTAYEMRISDWSSDVCSSDLLDPGLVDQAIADPTTHDEVRADHDRVVAAGGYGVPTLFFPDGQCFFGPVVIDPPTEGDAVLRLWRAVKIGRASCRARVCQYV